jgi:hypothetical protein
MPTGVVDYINFSRDSGPLFGIARRRDAAGPAGQRAAAAAGPSSFRTWRT